VVVGNLVYELGGLQYEKMESGEAEYWIMGVAVTGGTMLTVILVILVIYKRKSTRAERQFKRLQLQLDSLESNIRNECKQGAVKHTRFEFGSRHPGSGGDVSLVQSMGVDTRPTQKWRDH